jgi:hypothetical protein
MEAQIAALEIGSVRMMPTTTDTMMPMINGWSCVAVLINVPSQFIATAMAGHVR